MYLEKKQETVETDSKNCAWELKLIPTYNELIPLDDETKNYIQNIDKVTNNVTWNKNTVEVNYSIKSDDKFLSKGFAQFITSGIITGLVLNIFTEAEKEILFSLSARIDHIIDWNIILNSNNNSNDLTIKVVYAILNTTIF